MKSDWIFALGLLAASTAWAGTPLERAEILDYRTVTLAAPAAAREFTRALVIFERDVTLQLTDNHAPFATLDAEQRRRIFAGGNRYLRGTVDGADDSWVRLSWTGGQWSGGIFDGRELFLLDSAETVADLTPRSLPAGAELVLYRLSDLRLPISLARPLQPDMITGASAEPLQRRQMAAWRFACAQEALRPCRRAYALRGVGAQLPVTIVSDTQFSSAHGGNTAAVTAARINFVDGIYTAEVGVGIGLHHHEILANNSTLTSTDSLVLLDEQFRPYMTTGAGSTIPSAGVAHLFTGRELDDGVAGIAYEGTLCSPAFGFGVDGDFDASETIIGLVFAHELGHNFGAPHDNAPPEEDSACEDEPDGRIMAPSVGPKTAHEFSACSLQQMQDEINSAICFVEAAIFRDRFEQ